MQPARVMFLDEIERAGARFGVTPGRRAGGLSGLVEAPFGAVGLQGRFNGGRHYPARRAFLGGAAGSGAVGLGAPAF